VRWSALLVLWSLALVLYNAYEWWLIYGWRQTSPIGFWLFAFLFVPLLFTRRRWARWLLFGLGFVGSLLL
jgi:hypothetical protein